MKKLLILSGKGGTGKTTMASAFIDYLECKSVADCDVDAPNLHIMINPSSDPYEIDFFGLPKASIDKDKCIECNKCIEYCRFKAINSDFTINPYACEGCKVCTYICPNGAINMQSTSNGKVKIYNHDRNFVTANLNIGAGNSGKLVTEVKKNMKDLEQNQISIIDGSPGIGCPVIASVSGVDMVLIVTEPSISGISDLNRIIKTIGYFKTKCAVCINKYDTSANNTNKIIEYCNQNDINIVGFLPFDKMACKAINNGKSIISTESELSKEAKKIIVNTIKLLK